MVKQIFLIPQVTQNMVIIKKLVYTGCLIRYRMNKYLEFQEIKKYKKNQNFMELLPSAQSSSRNKHFVSTTKNSSKNRN